MDDLDAPPLKLWLYVLLILFALGLILALLWASGLDLWAVLA